MNQTISLTRNPNLSAPKIDRSTPNEVLQKFQNNWWTGLHPEKCKGFDQTNKVLFALPLLNLQIASRQDVLDYFDNTWTLTEVLFSGIKSETTYTRPPYHQLRHPKIFYYGHTAVLFLNKLRLAGVIADPVDLYLEKVLETGVDEMSWDDMSKNEMLWPSLETVHAYKKKIYNIVKELILTHPSLNDCSKITPSHPMWALFMGFEHEKIHFETSSVLIRELPLELVETPKYWVPLHPSGLKASTLKPTEITPTQWHKHSGNKSISWGKPETAPSFGWDNEYGHRSKEIKDFQVTKDLITNAQFFDFVSSLAYSNDKYWSEEGLLWRKFRNTKRPTFWVGYGPEGSHEYKLRTIFEIIDMPWNWPVEVNYHEATAFARWKQEQDNSTLKYRMITEPEHVALRKSTEDEVLQKTTYDNFNESTHKYAYNFNFNFSSASPVGDHGKNDDVSDLFGNVWQWAEDQFNPLEGFKINPLYDDFSTPCFDGKHQMILGGSFISCGHEASKWARFHFRPHFFQHAGFRIAATLDGSDDNGSTKLSKNATYVHPQRFSALNQLSQNDWWKNTYQPLELSPDEIRNNWTQATNAFVEWEALANNTSPSGSALDVRTNNIKEGFVPPYQASKNFPSGPQNLDHLLNLITKDLAPLGQAVGHPGYMAYVAGAGNSISNIAQALSQTINQFTGHYSLSPGLVSLEQEAISWIVNMLDYPLSAGGVFTTGGSIANLQALSIARKEKLKGYDLSKGRFYCSAQVHHCVGKALSILGFPYESLVLINTTPQQNIETTALESQIKADLNDGLQPLAIIGTAGSTNTGAVDDLETLGAIAKKYNLWFHVDAAYGGFFLLTDKGKAKLKGIEKSDSVALDPHKSFSLPYGTGCLIVRVQEQMKMTYAGASTYMPPSSTQDSAAEPVDYADISLELSRDARGLKLWLPVKYFGIEAFKINLEEKLALTEHLYFELKKFKKVVFANSPDLSIITYRLNNDQETKDLMDYINLSNEFFLTSCKLEGKLHIRVCLLGFKTHFKQVSSLVELHKKHLGE